MVQAKSFTVVDGAEDQEYFTRSISEPVTSMAALERV